MTESLADTLLAVEPKPASYISTARQIESLSGEDLRPVRVSVLSCFTAEILRPYIVVEGARRGLRILSHFCPFNQIEIQALNPASDLYQWQPDAIVIALRLEEIAPELVWRYTTLSAAQVEADLVKLQERLQGLIVHIRQHSEATMLVFNFASPVIVDAGLADASLEVPQSSAVGRANDVIASVCRAQPAVYVFDYARLVAEHGQSRWHDAKLLYTARIPFSLEGQISLGKRLARYVRAVLYPPCKCLVLDLDNTLWGGVLGEEGLGGIALGEDYPGNVYKQFQRHLLALRDQGILLAIASKNNEAEVIEAFEHHPDMLLKLSDFAATQIHWGDKASSLNAIAAELNIGLDALVFFDDSQVERAWVRRNFPEVTVIDVPSDPLHYVAALEESETIDRLVISDDDRQRADMMQQSRQREQLHAQAASMEDFLRDLAMTATIGKLGPVTLPRVVQLLAKTNQFNLIARRHTGAQLQALIEQQHGIVLWMRLKDRFGDNGLVGIAIGIPESREQWRIDSFLLSCRVIGRGAETALLGVLAQYAAERGCQTLVGEYIPTAKNSQVADFYVSHGFQAVDDSGQYQVLDLTKAHVALPEFIHIEYEERQEFYG